jgi:LCP family protein required for cell wall assembly
MHDTAPFGAARATPRSSWLLRALFLLVIVVAGGVAGIVAWLVLDTSMAMFRGSSASAEMPAPPQTYTSPGIVATPMPESETAPNVWDRHGPLNVLLLGLDEDDCARPNPDAPRRTDTIIVGRVDPRTGRAAMLSVPRDLYVYIPEYGAKKINTAHVLGTRPDEPGSGPALLARVLQENLELSAQRYVRIDFEAFRRLIDEGLGGLEMDLPPSVDDPLVSLYDPEYPDGHCGIMTVRFAPGRQRLTGDQVLQYARSRKTTSDFDRSRRQMEVLVAIKDQAASPAILPRLPKLLPALLDAVDTDLSASEILSLARIARGINRDDIVSLRVDESVVYPDTLMIDDVPQAVLRLDQSAFDDVRWRFLEIVPLPTATPTASATSPVPDGAPAPGGAGQAP